MQKRLIYILLCFVFPFPMLGQIYIDIDFTEEEELIKTESEFAVADMDLDGITDSIRYNFQEEFLRFLLSSRKFEPMDIPWPKIPCRCTIEAINGGFTYETLCMRAFANYSYLYDKEVGKFRWTGFSDEYLGNAANDGSGTQSFDLITGEYVADFKYFGMDLNYLFSLPTITEKYDVPPIYLGDEDFELPPYDTLYTYYKDKHYNEYIKNPQNYDEFKRLFKQITPAVDSIYVDLQNANKLSSESPFNAYRNPYNIIVTHTYIPDYKGLDIFILNNSGDMDGGNLYSETEIWTYKDGKFQEAYTIAYGFEGEGGSCEQTVKFNADTTLLMDYAYTPSSFAWGFAISVSEKYKMKCSIDHSGNTKKKNLIEEKFFDIEYTCPYFYPERNGENWTSDDDYPHPSKENPYSFYSFHDLSPIEGYFYVDTTAEFCSTTFYTKDKQGNIIDEFTISADKTDCFKQASAIMNRHFSLDLAIEPAVIKTSVGDVLLMPDGYFVLCEKQ